MTSVALDDSEIPDVILKGCKTPAPLFIRVIVTGILSVVVYVMIAGATQYALQQANLTLPILAMVVACVVVYISAHPIFNFLTKNLRNCTGYYRFKRLFRDEFGKKGVTREMALNRAEERLEMEREMRRRMQGPRTGIGVQQNVGNGMSFSLGGYY